MYLATAITQQGLWAAAGEQNLFVEKENLIQITGTNMFHGHFVLWSLARSWSCLASSAASESTRPLKLRGGGRVNTVPRQHKAEVRSLPDSLLCEPTIPH